MNQDKDRRVRGGSAKFTRVKDREPGHERIFSTPLETRDAIIALNKQLTNSWESVLTELYSDRTASSPSAKQHEGQAYVVRYDNDAKPQYYIHTLKRKATLSHIQPDGNFWSHIWKKSSFPKYGEMCYTNGFVWTNPNPRWQWKSNDEDERIIRVKINIPEGNQVIIDRAPVDGGTDCQLENGHYSLFPDVLLAPAEFRVTHVMRYRSKEVTYEDEEKSHEFLKYVKPRMVLRRNGEYNDLEYAESMVYDSNEFIDVSVEMTRQVELPEVGSITLN